MPITKLTGPIISAGQSLSNALDCGGVTLLRVYMPAAWTDAVLTFQLSPDGTNYADLLDHDGFEISRRVVPGSVVSIEELWGRNIALVKFRSGTRGKPVVQTADRTFVSVTSERPV